MTISIICLAVALVCFIGFVAREFNDIRADLRATSALFGEFRSQLDNLRGSFKAFDESIVMRYNELKSDVIDVCEETTTLERERAKHWIETLEQNDKIKKLTQDVDELKRDGATTSARFASVANACREATSDIIADVDAGLEDVFDAQEINTEN